MIIFERNKGKYTVVGEVMNYYNSATGKRSRQELCIYERGPRGGRSYVFCGSINDATQRSNDLRQLINAAYDSPTESKVR